MPAGISLQLRRCFADQMDILFETIYFCIWGSQIDRVFVWGSGIGMGVSNDVTSGLRRPRNPRAPYAHATSAPRAKNIFLVVRRSLSLGGLNCMLGH